MPKKIDAFVLKIVAVIAMLLNHVGFVFGFEQRYPWLFIFTEVIGKLTYPIMAYLLVEGYNYTRDKRKYALRLAFFWLISIVPYFLTIQYPMSFTLRVLVNNVMFTLLMGLIMMIYLEKSKSVIAKVLILFVFIILTAYSDWSGIGIVLIFAFYTIKKRKAKVLFPVLWYGLVPSIINIILSRPRNLYHILSVSTMSGILLVIPLLLSYNGKRGYSPKWVKWGFYLFYPLHLMILYAIRRVVLGA